MSEALFTLAKDLGHFLQARAWKLVTAESCTGGGLAYWITSISGSSQWFDRAFVTYQDDAKQQMLGIDPYLLKQHGALSQEIAVEMAEKALTRSQAQISIGITGLAGPNGGSIDIPIGTVWIALKSPTKTMVQRCAFTGDRFEIREKAIAQAIMMVLTL